MSGGTANGLLFMLWGKLFLVLIMSFLNSHYFVRYEIAHWWCRTPYPVGCVPLAIHGGLPISLIILAQSFPRCPLDTELHFTLGGCLLFSSIFLGTRSNERFDFLVSLRGRIWLDSIVQFLFNRVNHLVHYRCCNSRNVANWCRQDGND